MTAPLIPTTLDPAELDPVSRTIAHWRGADVSTRLVSGQLGTFTRGATATLVDTAGAAFTAANAMPRWEPRDWLATGLRTHMGLLMGTADRLTWTADWRPRALAFLVEFVENGTRTGSGTVFAVSNAADSGARLVLASNGTNYGLTHHNGTAGLTVTLSGAQAATNDRVTVRGYLYADGSVQLWQSLNGGAETFTARSAANALAAAWGAAALLRLNATGTGAGGAAWYRRLKLVPGNPDPAVVARTF
jgi:hypothetical protein